jgi:hypothetical protein
MDYVMLGLLAFCLQAGPFVLQLLKPVGHGVPFPHQLLDCSPNRSGKATQELFHLVPLLVLPGQVLAEQICPADNLSGLLYRGQFLTRIVLEGYLIRHYLPATGWFKSRIQSVIFLGLLFPCRPLGRTESRTLTQVRFPYLLLRPGWFLYLPVSLCTPKDVQYI